VKSLDELGDKFSNFIRAGLPTKEAYYATKAMELKEKVYAPDAIGRVSDSKVERDYYTSAELDALTDEEMDANWDKVMRSMGRLNKR
jgi:tripartite-type tricarboxylate transporter receptor subunit TctC